MSLLPNILPQLPHATQRAHALLDQPSPSNPNLPRWLDLLITPSASILPINPIVIFLPASQAFDEHIDVNGILGSFALIIGKGRFEPFTSGVGIVIVEGG
jgi:hypothetical protein